jgi:hypothetical protein
VLLDSSTNAMPVIALKNRGGSDYWQLRGIISQGDPSATYLDFASQAGIRMTLTGEGRLGLGNSNPSERLDVTGNVRISGEVNRTATGAANLVPVAYGTVLANGTITSSNGSGRLHVYLHTPAGVQTDAIFSFIVYKQQALITRKGYCLAFAFYETWAIIQKRLVQIGATCSRT